MGSGELRRSRATVRLTTRVVAVALATTLVLGADLAAAAGPVFPPTMGPWTYQGSGTVTTGYGGQGYASIPVNGGYVWGGLTATKVLRANGTLIVRMLPWEGYTHIGDPDAHQYSVYVPLQRDDGVRKAGYQVRNWLSGAEFLAEWNVPSGYQTNNSFITISPDARWMITGGWGNQTYFHGFDRPTAGGPINLRFRITLDRTLRNIQGCDFVTNMRMICQDDVEGAGNKSVWQIDMNNILDGSNRTARTTRLGPAPGDQTDPACREGESEGVDYNPATKTMRTTFIDGCSTNLTSTLYNDYK